MNANHFFVSLFITIVFIIAMGAATNLLYQSGTPARERVFRAYRALAIAGLFFFIVFISNYYLASSGIQRSLTSEKLMTDPLLRYLMKGSEMRSNNLLALLIVIGSFIAGAYFLSCAGLVFKALKERAWRQDPLEFALLMVKFLLTSSVAFVCLFADTSLLLFRTETMMWPEDLAKTPATLPSPFTIMKGQAGTMGAFLLSIFCVWYPICILLAEKHFASSWAHLSDACRELAQERARQAQPQDRNPLAPAAPAAAQMPFIPLPPPAPQQGGSPAPGGAAPWVRPIPFNPGANGGNGRRRAEV